MKLSDLAPGAIVPRPEPIDLNAGLPVTTLRVTNDGEYPVHLTAHFHVFEANPMLRFDRKRAFGRRPDLPSGGAIRFEPGETKTIRLVPIGGRRIVRGFAGLINGPLDRVDVDTLVEWAVARGYRHEPEPED
ncbi:MAG TPA: urease subunit beta [Nitrolancea sp.]|jgi:urease beta subunit|nr:urease subunit beta [Nitrolancea sp.]